MKINLREKRNHSTAFIFIAIACFLVAVSIAIIRSNSKSLTKENLKDISIFIFNGIWNLEDSRLNNDTYLNRLNILNKVFSNSPNARIAFIGDSITEYFDIDELGIDYAINLGIAGDTTKGVIERLNFYVETNNIEIVFILIGYNDLYFRSDIEIIRNIRSILNILSNRTIYVHTILPISNKRPFFNKRIENLNSHIKKFQQEHSGVQVIDIHSRFYDLKYEGIHTHLTRDGVHLNSDGYKTWKQVLKYYITLNSSN